VRTQANTIVRCGRRHHLRARPPGHPPNDRLMPPTSRGCATPRARSSWGLSYNYKLRSEGAISVRLLRAAGRSLGTTRYGLIRCFFAVFSAIGILRRLEAQPDRRLSQGSPLRRPGVIILGYASSADWSERLRRSAQHDLQPTSPTATYRAIGTWTGARISLHHGCAPQGN
jgi:hypothetical protein